MKNNTYERLEIVQLLAAPPLAFAIYGNMQTGETLFLDPVPAFALVREHVYDVPAWKEIPQSPPNNMPTVTALTPNGMDLEPATATGASGLIIGSDWSFYEDCSGHDPRLPAMLQAGDYDGACAVVREGYRRMHERQG